MTNADAITEAIFTKRQHTIIIQSDIRGMSYDPRIDRYIPQPHKGFFLHADDSRLWKPKAWVAA